MIRHHPPCAIVVAGIQLPQYLSIKYSACTLYSLSRTYPVPHDNSRFKNALYSRNGDNSLLLFGVLTSPLTSEVFVAPREITYWQSVPPAPAGVALA